MWLVKLFKVLDITLHKLCFILVTSSQAGVLEPLTAYDKNEECVWNEHNRWIKFIQIDVFYDIPHNYQ